jgi:hypothetical protein
VCSCAILLQLAYTVLVRVLCADNVQVPVVQQSAAAGVDRRSGDGSEEVQSRCKRFVCVCVCVCRREQAEHLETQADRTATHETDRQTGSTGRQTDRQRRTNRHDILNNPLAFAGLLSVTDTLPGGPAHSVLQPGDLVSPFLSSYTTILVVFVAIVTVFALAPLCSLSFTSLFMSRCLSLTPFLSLNLSLLPLLSFFFFFFLFLAAVAAQRAACPGLRCH